MRNDYCDRELGKGLYENDDCIEGHPDSDFQDPALSIDFEDFEECPDPDGYSDEDYQDLLSGF